MYRKAILVFLALLLVFLPLVPLEYAPVVPHRTYRLVWRSLGAALYAGLAPLPGVDYRFAWGTLPVLAVLFLALGWVIFRLFKENSNAAENTH